MPGAEVPGEPTGDARPCRGLPAPPRGTAGRPAPPPQGQGCPGHGPTVVSVQQEELWAARAGCGEVYVWSLKDLARPPQAVHLPDCSQVRCLLLVKRQVSRPPSLAGSSAAGVAVYAASCVLRVH